MPDRDGPLSLSSLAERISLDKSTTSRMIDVLERKNLVRGTEDPEDARALRLELIDSGRELYSRIETEALSR